MILRLLNVQGIAGIAVSLVLAVLLVVQRSESRQWKKKSGSFEQLYHQEQAAFAGTVADYRSAVEQARAADQANAKRVAAEQRAINERTNSDYERRLAAARAAAERLRLQSQAATDLRDGRDASMPRIPVAAGGAAQAPGEDRLRESERLTATEQAIQLDELIKWVRAQAGVDPNDAETASP
jgi:hypothetical protein